MTIRSAARAWPVALLLLGCAGGCAKPFRPVVSSTLVAPAPTANSPKNAIRLFEWGWDNRDITRYEQVFAADFRFLFALGDSAGNEFRDDPFDREIELDVARHLFVGGGAVAPATSIVLNLDPTLLALADSRPGKNPRWHREIVTSVDLIVRVEDGTEYRILGNARFFVVRGDSALIPPELGVGPDSTRWYVDQWNDETLPGAGAVAAGRVVTTAVASTHAVTWGQLKALYR
jgi:hypothetical protein